MTDGCGVFLKLIIEPFRYILFDVVKEYVGYIGSCKTNISSLNKNLSELCVKKDDISQKLKVAENRGEVITREARRWFKDVRILTEGKELRKLMYKDMETAKIVMKIMEKKDLKMCLSEEIEMQNVVVRVLKKLKEEMEKSKDEDEMIEQDYMKVAEVVVEVMKDMIEEFKKLIKDDTKLAVIATRMLIGSDLEKLMHKDKEMKAIFEDAENVSDEEQRHPINYVAPGKPNAPVVDNNPINEVVQRLFTPLGSLVTPLKKLMNDPKFNKYVSHSESIKLGLEVVDGLLLKNGMDDNTKQYRGCRCCSLYSYHDRYQVSKAAEGMAKHILNDIISKCPQGQVSSHKVAADMKTMPTQFLKGLGSRTRLLEDILDKLQNDQIDSVGVYGMGGTGKTTLAKEIIKHAKEKGLFNERVMVEISDVPDIARIQADIADLLDLPLHSVKNVAHGANMIYDRLVSKKENKILVILDNVWKKMNLDDIGIPHSCKLLVTTREKDVCRAMGVQKEDMLKVSVMNINEARDLFNSQTKNQAEVKEYKHVAQRLLEKCGGLPLTIVTTANSLKDKDLSSWEKFLRELKRPISSQVDGEYGQTYTILNTSYKFIFEEEKRIFFLLACLSSIGSSVSTKTLMRHGIGLNLFQHMNNLSEAMERVDKWVEELVRSSMLFEGDAKGFVKIHDIMRNFAIQIAAKDEGHKFMVEAIPRWLDNETFQTYTAMSLMYMNDYSRLNGVEASKLQILILKGDLLSSITDSFFDGMLNLKVLDMSGMNFPSLPESMWKLDKLRTLCLESCKLGDIKVIGKLSNLLVLSLHKSFLDELPIEIGELYKLRLLDLSRTTSNKMPLIPTGVLSRLSQLEGLYMVDKRQGVNKTLFDGTNTIEADKLSYLNALEIHVSQIEQLPVDGEFNLDKFRVSVGSDLKTDVEIDQVYCRVVDAKYISNIAGILDKSCLKTLLKKVDCLRIQSCESFENLVPQLDQDGFRDLSNLIVNGCRDVECIVKSHGKSDLLAFSRLKSLHLSNMSKLKKVCDGEVSQGTFSKLESLSIDTALELAYVLPISLIPRNLTKLETNTCLSVRFMFKNNRTRNVTELRALESLELYRMYRLLSFVGPEPVSDECDGLQRHQVFFNEEIVFTSLKQLRMMKCPRIVKLWGKEISDPSFRKLREIEISECEKLSNVGSCSVFAALVQLETLIIGDCGEIREVIAQEEGEESEIIRFLHLKFLHLRKLLNLESFCGTQTKLEFPQLKKLNLKELDLMKTFAKSQHSTALFHENLDFPRLEELEVMRVNDDEDTGVTGLWDLQASLRANPAPSLRHLILGGRKGLGEIPPLIFQTLTSLTLKCLTVPQVISENDEDTGIQDLQGSLTQNPSVGSRKGLLEVPPVIFETLTSLTLEELREDVLFSSSDLPVEEGLMWKYSQLPKLEELSISRCDSMTVFSKEDDSNCSDSFTFFCGQFRKLHLRDLRNLNVMPLHIFKGLVSLELSHLNWEFVISVDLLGESLQQLELLKIEYCPWMSEVVVIKDVSVIKFPRLKELTLTYLESATSFASAPRGTTLLLPLLESLEISSCYKLEHFWSGSIEAPGLQSVILSQCVNMRRLMKGNPDHLIELSSLQKVHILQCYSIESISSGPLTTPKLRVVILHECPHMKSFLRVNPNHNGDPQFPSLETVIIAKCPRLQTFSSKGSIIAPNLMHLRYERKEYPILQFKDLNDFVRQMSWNSAPKVEDHGLERDVLSPGNKSDGVQTINNI